MVTATLVQSAQLCRVEIQAPRVAHQVRVPIHCEESNGSRLPRPWRKSGSPSVGRALP